MRLILLSVTWITAMVLSFEGLSASAIKSKELSINKNTFFAATQSVSSQNLPDDAGVHPEEKIYVVIGVFALKSNAIKFADYAGEKGFPSKYLLNSSNNLYYVYLLDSEDWGEAKKERSRILAATNIFPGIWLFQYKSPVGEATVAATPSVADEIKVDSIAEPEKPAAVAIAAPPTEVQKAIEVEDDEFLLYPNVVYAHNYKEIKARVEIIDPIRSKLIKTVDAHELSTIRDPNNGSHTIQVIADAFGYRKVQHDISLADLTEERVSSFVFLRGDTILIEFPMERLKTGDIATMYNVFFKNDAAVMESASKYELGSLMEMLKENPEYTIMIHGHTNGNKRGRIIKLLEENPDFFNITEENKRASGSAKKLSQERAMTIKKYLVENGIAEERMAVKGWGGSKMIYDKNSLDAKKNVRVEIEILQD